MDSWLSRGKKITRGGGEIRRVAWKKVPVAREQTATSRYMWGERLEEEERKGWESRNTAR